MNWIKRHLRFLACLAVWLVAVALEGAWLACGAVNAHRAMRLLERKRQERDAILRLAPAPSEASARAIEADLAAARLALIKLRGEIAPTGTTATSAPLDEYLAISQFVDESRRRALAQRIILKPGERFGLASYSHEGPPAELMSAVQRQRAALRELLWTLIAAGPRELLAVRRERLGAAPSARPEEAGAAADYFTPPVRSPNETSGLTRVLAFQVEFSGGTPVLRDFMTALARSPLPLAVRCVEAESIPTRESPAPGVMVPVVASAVTRFSVTVDCVELLAPAGSP